MLVKVTTHYSDHEDRLCLTGQDADEHVYEMWLTRRLADRLFSLLIDWLEKQKTGQTGSDLIQGFEQERAVGHIEPQAKVSATTDQQHVKWLIDNIDITKGDDALVMTFKASTDQEASLAMKTIELRQWLNICSNAYKQADWPLTPWPHWINLDRIPDTIPDLAQIH